MDNLEYQRELAKLEERKLFHELKAKEVEHQRSQFVLRIMDMAIDQKKESSKEK